MLESPAFLNVEASITGRRWLGPAPRHIRLGAAIAQAAGLPELVGRILARRGVAPHEAQAHLAPSLRDLMPDPSSLRDMDLAAARFWRAVKSRERIAVFADYDVDGAASAALILTWLRQMGHAATLYVPDRIDEGYGPNVPAMQALGATHDLIVCVDCGSLSHAPIAAAGCDVIVLDHHLGPETLPPALAVVNPNRQDEDGSLGHLCAAAVVFLMLVAVNRLARGEGVTGPDLLGFLDLVALATVADVAPLTGLNRALVRQGLTVMSRNARPGLTALGEVASLKAHQRLTHSASSSVRGSTPAAASARPTSAPDSSPPTTRTRRPPLPPASTPSTPSAATSRPRSAPPPRPRRRPAASTARWSGPPAPAGIPASSASSPPASRRPSAGPPW